MDPVRDVTMIENTPIDYLDFASPESGLGGKIGLDATNKWPPETKREWGEEIRMDQKIIDLVDRNGPHLDFRAAESRSGNSLELHFAGYSCSRRWMLEASRAASTSSIAFRKPVRQTAI